MAPTAKHFSLLFFVSLLSSQLSHARDLQSFSKLTNTPTTTTTTTATPTANAQETIQVPNKEQEPRFLPDTQNGYGLYGHESGQLPPTTTTTAPTTNTNNNPYSYYNKEAYVTNPQGMSDTRFVSRGSTTTTDNHPYKEAYVTDSQGYITTNNNYYYKGANNDYYNAQKQGVLGDTKLVDGGYTTTANAAATTDNHPYKDAYVTDPQSYTTTNKNYYFKGANNDYYNAQQQGLSDTKLVDGGYTTTANAATGTTTPANNYNYNGANNYYNTQKQGMSDTRFLENGKYYYDAPRYNNYGYEKSRGVNTVNYNYKGHNGYNENSYMEGYQNQGQFQENEEEYIP